MNKGSGYSNFKGKADYFQCFCLGQRVVGEEKWGEENWLGHKGAPSHAQGKDGSKL